MKGVISLLTYVYDSVLAGDWLRTEYAIALKDEVHRHSRVGHKFLCALFNHLAFKVRYLRWHNVILLQPTSTI